MARAITRGVAIGALFAALALSISAWGQSRPCGCYCGKWLPAPCSDNACKAACGWQPPASGGGPASTVPSFDDEAARRAREEAERQRDEAERREQERARADRQRQFERERDAAATSLKGGGNTASFGVAPADSGLRAPDEGGDQVVKSTLMRVRALHASRFGPLEARQLLAEMQAKGLQNTNAEAYLRTVIDKGLTKESAWVAAELAGQLQKDMRGAARSAAG